MPCLIGFLVPWLRSYLPLQCRVSVRVGQISLRFNFEAIDYKLTH
jgi:hypothetical protein